MHEESTLISCTIIQLITTCIYHIAPKEQTKCAFHRPTYNAPHKQLLYIHILFKQACMHYTCIINIIWYKHHSYRSSLTSINYIICAYTGMYLVYIIFIIKRQHQFIQLTVRIYAYATSKKKFLPIYTWICHM